MILNDFFAFFQKSEKEMLIYLITSEEICMLVAVSNDPMVMQACDIVVVLENGMVKS